MQGGFFQQDGLALEVQIGLPLAVVFRQAQAFGQTGQFFIAVGAVLMLLPFGDSLLFIGLILIGLGCAPIYPSIIHETPANFGADLSQGIIGIQMAFAYVGTCLMPPVFGVLGQHISFGLYPVFLMAILILMVVMAERMHRVTAEKRNSYKANY